MKGNFSQENSGAVIIKRPHITEKSTTLSEGRAYTFVVDARANKKEIEEAVKEVYKVTPVKVRVMNVSGKTTRRRGIKGRTASFKKAIVFLKEGDSIELI